MPIIYIVILQIVTVLLHPFLLCINSLIMILCINCKCVIVDSYAKGFGIYLLQLDQDFIIPSLGYNTLLTEYD